MNATQATVVSSSAQSGGRKEYPRRMRYVVFAVLIAIVASLVSALVFVYRDESGSRRAVKALSIRVALSIGLFLLLMLAYGLGFVPDRL